MLHAPRERAGRAARSAACGAARARRSSVEAVEVVVARRAVGAERDDDAGRDQLGHAAQMPDASLRFDDGHVQTCAPRAASSARSSSAEVDAVRDARVRAEQAELVEHDDVVLAEPLAHERDLAACSRSRACGCRRRAPSPARRPRGAARRCTTARTAARTRSAGGRRRRRASARSAARDSSSERCVDSRSPGRDLRIVGVHHRLADRRADAALLGGREDLRRCDGPCPCRGSRSCRRAAARRTRARRRAAPRPRRARPRTARSPCGASRAARGRRRGRARASGRCGRAPARAPASRRSRRSRGSCSRASAACSVPPTWTIAPSRVATSPASTRCCGSIVRIVPPRKMTSLTAARRPRSHRAAARRPSSCGARPAG